MAPLSKAHRSLAFRIFKTLALLPLLGAAACTIPLPEQAIPIAPVVARPAVNLTSSPKDPALVRHYATLELRLKAQGLLRTEQSPSDAPVKPAQLRKNFERVALRVEHQTPDQSQSVLKRWTAPVRVQMQFGGSVSGTDRARLRRSAQSTLGLIAKATGHSITSDQSNPNIHIFVVSEAERRALAPTLSAILPQIGLSGQRFVANLDRSNQCLAIATGASQIDGAIIIIRSELSLFMQRGCLHEELAQAMGLPNDHPGVRPSVFNDDEEFMLLTNHDLTLLKTLYSPGLSPGMTLGDVRPKLLTLLPDTPPPAPEIVASRPAL